MRGREGCRSAGLSAYRLWKVTSARGAGGAVRRSGGRGRRAQRVARDGGSRGAGVVTQCDVSAPSARYAPAPSSVAARTRPPNDAPPPRALSHTGF